MLRPVLALIATACLGAACTDHHPRALPPVEAAPPGTAGEARVDLLGAGSTFVFPIMSKWVGEYDGVARTRVKYLSSGSSDGVKRITAQTVDFGASDVAMSDEELALAPGPIVHIPITLGAVVVAYSREGLPARLKLSREAIAGILLGDIKKWDDAKIAATNRDVRASCAGSSTTARGSAARFTTRRCRGKS
jgi:phosphate transport system substrate-binding protein